MTEHWRQFISPLMWRFRWLELQIKKLQSQSLKYDRELALYDQRKQSICEHFSIEECGVKSTEFSSHIQRHRVMKRKRRKKIEETTEVASYMAQHNLFSYYGIKSSTILYASLFSLVSPSIILYSSFVIPEKNTSFADDMFLEDTLLKLGKQT